MEGKRFYSTSLLSKIAFFCRQKLIKEFVLFSKSFVTTNRLRDFIPDQFALQSNLRSIAVIGFTLSTGINSAPAPISVFAFVPAFSLVLALSTLQNLFLQFMQAYLEDCRAFSTLFEQKKTSHQLFMAYNPNFYYRNFHIEYYYFCKYCENYFDIARGKRHKQMFFATFFQKGHILYRWQ